MSFPTVSIIVPCFNQAPYLDECLQSVLNQSFYEWECLIINDGSTDDTEQIAREWCKRDHRFKYYYKENQGVSNARNYGVLKSSGIYILPLDGDDKIGEDYLRLVVAEFKKDSSLIIAYSNAFFFGKVNAFWNLADFDVKSFLLDNCIYCSAVFKKEDFLKIGGYDENMKYGYEDWEFWINLISKYEVPVVKKIDYLGFYYRRKFSSRDVEFTNNQEKKKEAKFLIYKKHHLLYDKYFGGYIDNLNNQKKIQIDIDNLLKSEKFVLNLFTKKFLGFEFFKMKEIKIFK